MRKFAVVMALAGSLLVGCGSGETSDTEASKSPARILSDAQRAVRTARSVHITGKGPAARLHLSLVRGSKASGTMDLFGGSVDLIRLHNDLYMRGDRSFWRHFGRNPRKIALLTDRWVAAPSSLPALRGIASLTDISGLSSMLAEHGKVVKEGVRTFRGQKVIALHDATEGGTLYLKAIGTPYPVALVERKNDHGETVIFDRWNQHVVVTAPKNPLSLGVGT